MNFLIAFIARILTWGLGVIPWALLTWLTLIFVGLAAVFINMPVPAWMLTAPSVLSNIPSGVAYFTRSLHIVDGLTIVLSAYGLRFIIRRLPFVG